MKKYFFDVMRDVGEMMKPLLVYTIVLFLVGCLGLGVSVLFSALLKPFL